MIRKMIQKMMMTHHLCRPTLDHRRTRSSRTRPSPRPRRTHASSSAPFAFAVAVAVAVACAHPHPCPHPFDPWGAHSATDRLCRCLDAIDRWMMHGIDRIDRSDGWMDGWIDHRVIFTGRDSTCMGHARIARARARERESRVESLLDRVCGRTVCVSLSLYTQTPRTPITHAGRRRRLSLSLSLSRVTTRGCPLASLEPPRHGAVPHTPTHDFPTMHGLTMTSAVVGTKMTTRATSSSSRVSRGALTIVNSGAGPKRVRPTRARTNARRDGWNARARGVARGGGGGARRSRARGTTRAWG